MSRKTALQPVPSKDDRPLLEDVISDVCRDVAGRSAILQKLAEASFAYNPGGINHPLDQHFWHGIEQLMRANILEVENLRDFARDDER
jgi:hypothetical protein